MCTDQTNVHGNLKNTSMPRISCTPFTTLALRNQASKPFDSALQGWRVLLGIRACSRANYPGSLIKTVDLIGWRGHQADS